MAMVYTGNKGGGSGGQAVRGITGGGGGVRGRRYRGGAADRWE